MFTLEIGGRPIAVTDADEAQARAIFQSEDFKHDLTVLTTQGKPLWDGKTQMRVRSASKQEIAAFEAPDLDGDDLDDDEDSENGLFVTFLVEIDHDHDET